MPRTSSKTNPQKIVARSRANRISAQSAPKSALSIIRGDIAPIGDEPDLLDVLCYLQEENDISGTIALYENYVAIAEAVAAIQNQPRTTNRASDFLEDEYCRAWSKAYLVADFLKDMRPDKLNIDFFADTLIRCAFKMGHNLSEIAAIAKELGAMAMPTRCDPRSEKT
jgi:hypothetical protein